MEPDLPCRKVACTNITFVVNAASLAGGSIALSEFRDGVLRLGPAEGGVHLGATVQAAAGFHFSPNNVST